MCRCSPLRRVEIVSSIEPLLCLERDAVARDGDAPVFEPTQKKKELASNAGRDAWEIGVVQGA